jgi:hypothetical protein
MSLVHCFSAADQRDTHRQGGISISLDCATKQVSTDGGARFDRLFHTRASRDVMCGLGGRGQQLSLTRGASGSEAFRTRRLRSVRSTVLGKFLPPEAEGHLTSGWFVGEDVILVGVQLLERSGESVKTSQAGERVNEQSLTYFVCKSVLMGSTV